MSVPDFLADDVLPDGIVFAGIGSLPSLLVVSEASLLCIVKPHDEHDALAFTTHKCVAVVRTPEADYVFCRQVTQ